MPSFGEKLKLEREKRSITLEQISLSTKIGIRMLQALESEKFDQLPGGIFNRGFVRAYARHVGLDEDRAITDYLEASGEGPPKTAAAIEAEAAQAEPRDPIPSRQIPWGLLAAVLLLVALALSLWTRWHKNEGHSEQAPAPATSQNLVANPATGASPGVPASAPNSPANSVQPSAPIKEVSPAPNSASGSTALVAAAEIAPAAANEFAVVILAREDSWLSITADGTTIFADTLVAENQRAVHARKQIVIRAGNTGALDFVFNGSKLPAQGDYGDVKTLTFGPGGLQPSAPAPPVTQ